MTSGFSVNGFAWPAIDASVASTDTGAGTLSQVAPQYGRGDHMDWGDGGWIVMIVMMVLFWGGVLGIAAWAVHSYSRRGAQIQSESPLDIARRRYASGEITQDEFDAIKRGLSSR